MVLPLSIQPELLLYPEHLCNVGPQPCTQAKTACAVRQAILPPRLESPEPQPVPLLLLCSISARGDGFPPKSCWVNGLQGLTFDLLHVHPLQGFSRFQDIPELHKGEAAQLSIWKGRSRPSHIPPASFFPTSQELQLLPSRGMGAKQPRAVSLLDSPTPRRKGQRGSSNSLHP